jgi:lipoate-protein ligase A
VTHDSFVQAVTNEFRKVYALPGDHGLQITRVTEDSVDEKKVWDGALELKTWEWEYGSSPEFSNLIEGELSFGTLVSPSRHSSHRISILMIRSPHL